MTFRVSTRRLAFLLSSIAALLIATHVILQAVRFWSGNHFLLGYLAAFSLGAENNFPTYFATIILLACSALLWLIGAGENRPDGYRPYHWYALGAVFLFLSMDEMMSIHERLSEPIRLLIGENQVFYYAWVLPYAVFVVLVAAAFWRFLLHLPRRTARLLVLSGTLYVCGALGFETISGYHSARFGNVNAVYVLYQTVEEVLEIAGALLFLYALADYIERRFQAITIALTNGRPPR